MPPVSQRKQLMDYWDEESEYDTIEFLVTAPYYFGRFSYRVVRGFFLLPRNLEERAAQIALLPVAAVGPILVYLLVTFSLPYWVQGFACIAFLVYFCSLAWAGFTLSNRYEEELEQREEY